MGTTTVKKHISFKESKKRDPQVYNEYYDLLKNNTSEVAKVILGKKYDRSPHSISKILGKERKKRNLNIAREKNQVAA